MELNSGDDLISLKESIQDQSLSYTESPPSVVSADEYARCNGLTIDSLRLDWQGLIEHDQAITSTLANLEPGQLIEGPQLPECLFRVIIPTAEQWQMPAASLQILQQVYRRCKEGEVADLTSQQCFSETMKWMTLKLDTPVLRSDHGTDCRRLARRVKAFMKEPLPDHRLPLHPVDVDKGEGLEFPKSMVQADQKQMHIVGQESLEVTRDTLVYLMQSLKSDLSEVDRQDFMESVSTYQGVGDREHLTPPLSPLQAPFPEYFIPEDESCEIPEPSNPSSRLSQDIEAAEAKIFEAEFEFWADALEKDESPGRYDDIDVSEMIRAGGFRPPIPPSSPQPVPRDLRIDVPLLPCSDDGGSGAGVTKVLDSEDLAQAKELIASSDTLSGSDGPTGQLVALFKKSATTVMRVAEQEKLQPLDATARVPVPVMDFAIPVLEWEARLWEAKAMFRWIQKDMDVDWQGPKWAHNRAAEQRMVWAPLAHLKEKKLASEQIEVDIEVLENFLGRCRDSEVFTSADYVYKKPGVAILRVADDEDDEEDYLTPPNSPRNTPSAHSPGDSWRIITSSVTEPTLAMQHPSLFTDHTATPPPADLTTLLSGKKRMIDETLREGRPSGKRPTASDISALDIIDSALVPSTNVLRGYLSEYTDFAPLVDNFLEMNFPKKPKLTHSSFFTPPSATPSPSTQTKADEAAKLMPPPPKPIPALAPTIIPPDTPPRIIISSTTSPLITHHLKALIPTIDLIPRNSSNHRPLCWTPGIPSPSLDEADIVVSPATGILLTTMIQLRQRALPSQPTPGNPNTTNNYNNTTTTFYRILKNVATRHERLVVLVSEGNKHSETASPLSRSDARALAELQAFAAGLSLAVADVQVVYVGGGVETSAKWVAATVCAYAGEAKPVREMLLPVETFWEVFLRRAGMNVFAAQVVLGRLKVPPDGRAAVGGGDGQVFGLPLFVMMERERRVELFEGVLGGRRVLERVSEAIDEPWGAPAVEGDGFDLELDPMFGSGVLGSHDGRNGHGMFT